MKVRHPRPALVKTLLFLAMFALLANAAVAQNDTRTAVIGLTADASFLDPHREINTTSVIVANHFFDALTNRDPRTMDTVPALAESWDIVDSTTYVFNIRQGVRFHDGTPLTAHDVKYSLDRILDPNFSNRVVTYATAIDNVELIDDYTVQINLKEAYAPFLNRMTSFYIVPQHYVEAVGNEEFNRSPMGSGPYKFVEWARDDHITAVANEDYWAGAPDVKRVVFRAIPEASTRIAALLSGEVHLADNVSADDVSVIERANCCGITLADNNTVYYLTINSSNEPFDDIRIRRALTHAINWDEILGLFDGYASRITFPSVPAVFGHAEISEYLEDKLLYYDPERARELLTEAGYASGLTVNLMVPAGRYPGGEDVIQAVASQFEEVGITPTIQVLEWGVFYGELYTAGLQRDISMNGTANPLFDPDHIMATNFDPKRSAFYYWHDDLTALIDQGIAETDPAARIEIYKLVMEHLIDQAPFIWGFQIQRIYGLSNSLEWTPRTDGRIFVDEARWAN